MRSSWHPKARCSVWGDPLRGLDLAKLDGDFHSHTTWSDGKDTPEAMAGAAIEVGYEALAITDHVRADSAWVPAYFESLAALAKRLEGRLLLLVGVEAKVVDRFGRLDAAPETLRKADLVLGGFHRIPAPGGGYFPSNDLGRRGPEVLAAWREAMLALLANPAVDIVTHPGQLLLRNAIAVPSGIELEVARAAKASGKFIEMNAKYAVPAPSFLAVLRAEGVPLVSNSDAHSVAELRAHARARLRAPHGTQDPAGAQA